MSVALTLEPGIAWLRLDRPRANVLDAAMIAALRESVVSLRRAPDLRLLVFEGAGTEFSFGASVEEHQADQVREMLGSFHALFREIEALGVPTAAAVRGRCLGGGLELAGWCGRVVAAPGATFACPEIKLGVFPPMGTLALDWRVGGGKALELLITGGAVNAAEAVAIGLADELHEDPTAAVRAWYDRHLAPLSASSVRIAWRAARMGLADRLERDLPRLEALYLETLMSTHDANEGIAAFLQKRPPGWTHR